MKFIHSGNEDELQRIMDQLKKPDSDCSKDRFKYKFAMICCNEFYNKSTLKNLQSVKEDAKNLKLIAQMMGIADENIEVLHDLSYDEMKKVQAKYELII